jgi:hypothetical protein
LAFGGGLPHGGCQRCHPLALEGFERSGGIETRRSAYEIDDPLKIHGTKLGRDLIDATLLEQQDGSDDSFRYALSGGPAHILGIEKNSKTIRHGHVDADTLREIRPAPLPAFEVRFETPPGEQAQVDFAQFQLQFTDELAVTRIVWLFSFVLGFSRLCGSGFIGQ